MIRRLSHAALAIALLFSFAQGAPQAGKRAPQRAAQKAPEPSTQSPETLRVTTRLVQVNVVVHDKKGEPVTGLTKGDFVLSDEGKPRDIAVFAVETSEPVQRPARQLPPLTYSNELDRLPSGATPCLTVILFDTLNTQFKDQAYAKFQLLKFLRQLQPQDRIAIYLLGNGLQVLHDFSGDMESLVRAVERYRGRINTEVEASIAEPSDSGDEELDAMLDAAGQEMANYYLQRRVKETLEALTAIADHLSSLPGRKNLIWVSGAFPFSYGLDLLHNPNPNANVPTSFPDLKVFNTDLARAARAVNNGNIAIYPVDARGLVGLADIMPSFSAASKGGSAAVMARIDSAAEARFMQTLDTMKDLAERTGGRAFYNTNDIKGSLRQAVDDTRVTYVLGFYPREEEWNGAFHKLKVQVRRPGVNVRARQGFYALPEESFTAKQHEQILGLAARAPLEATAIGLTVHLTPAAKPSEPLRFEVIVDPRQLTLTPSNGRLTGNLSMVFLQKAVDGKEFGNKGEEVSLNIAEQNYRQMETSGMAISGEWLIKPGAQQMRIVLCDNTTGTIGSVTVPLPGAPPVPSKKRRS